jgi:ribokinase
VEDLLARVAAVVVTRGAAGLLLAGRDGRRTDLAAVPARAVVDTTGAGDTFCGALAAALARGADLEYAARRAAAAGSLSVERPGAAGSAPTAGEVTARLAALEKDGR